MTPLPRAGADIVVPVYGAAEALRRCLASLRRHGLPPGSRCFVVLDGPQPASVEAVLGELLPELPFPVEAVRMPERRGFAAAANEGIARSEQDVALLNSDTEVTPRWLAKLSAAVHAADDFASATPFSNSATICSLPRWLEENAVPAAYSIDRFAALVEESALPERPAIPTGVGFCWLLKRRALQEVGPLDERRFGLGYGEEVDWCLRAARHGWRHVLDDATFVFHAGQASFGGERHRRVREAERRLRRSHPDFRPRLADFLRRDPLKAARQRVVDRLAPPAAPRRAGPRVLHIVHGWPPWNHAGTELYAARLARWQAAGRATSAMARIPHPERRRGDAVELLDHGVRVRLLVNNFSQRDPLSRAAIREPRFERALARLLDEERPEIVHVHHLAGLCASLPGLAKRRGFKVLYQVQDWWTLCARANLLDWRRQLCSGPGLAKCSRCLPLTGRLPAIANPLLYAWRGLALRRALRGADAWIMGSRFIADSFQRFALLPRGATAHVLPYGIDAWPRARPTAEEAAPLRVGFLGSLLPHKGAHVAVEAFRGIPPETATLEIFGDPGISEDYERELRSLASGSVSFRGSFPEGGEAELFGRLDVLVVPSLGLESYGLAPREALASGLRVVVSRRGALAELAAESPRCLAFEAGRADELRRVVLDLARDPDARRGEPVAAGPDWDTHATAVDEVYRRLVAGWRGR
jgi:GT2 family glycosyltransferase